MKLISLNKDSFESKKIGKISVKPFIYLTKHQKYIFILKILLQEQARL